MIKHSSKFSREGDYCGLEEYKIDDDPDNYGYFDCMYGLPVGKYLNDPKVREQLHVNTTQTWYFCPVTGKSTF